MATIEDLLGASTEDLEKMSQEELAFYLKDITNLEPKAKPTPLKSKLADESEDEFANPIKSKKKTLKPKKLSLAEISKEFE